MVITNEFAVPDGDIFPTAVQVEGRAPVQGMPSWGGVVGNRGDKPLVDVGMIMEPEYAFWFPKRGWGVENWGVEPDIEVPLLPQDAANGKDARLDRAKEGCLRLWDSKTWVEAIFEPEPTKTREDFSKKEGRTRNIYGLREVA